jgi:RHS repeat-associated protein
VRRFSYDSHSRLLTAKNPESGAISYSYDDDGNLQTKTAPSPNQPPGGTATVSTTYTYDTLNRLTGKRYVDGYASNLATASVSYGYDGNAPPGCTPPLISGATNLIGRRSAMCDASGAAAWSFDPLGRILTEMRTIAGSTALTKTLSYTYNLDGSLATLIYPSSRIITYTPSAAGRTLSAVDTANSLNYVTGASYAPQGALSALLNGASTNSRWTYNKRLQPLQIYFTNGTVAPTSQLQGNCPTTVATIVSRLYSFGLGTNDNGNAQSITDCLLTNNTQNFDYDSVNRIADAYTTGKGTGVTNWGEDYTIDAWGNLTNITKRSGWSNSEILNAASANVQNQLPGFGYDPAGNMTRNNPSTYAYDAENRMRAMAGWTYIYDGDGKRLIKCNGTYPTCVASGTTLYWTGVGSDTLAETSWIGAALEEYIFFNGKRVARRDGTGNTVHYYFADHLGSANAVTNAAGAIEKVSMYYPFGGEIPVTGVSVLNRYKFTGKERDAESGLDEFGARYYGSAVARFVTPDVPFADQHPADPQSWNLYAYTHNNPLVFVDDSGQGTRPAASSEVNEALASDPTLRSVILHSNNFSPGGFEDALNSGGLANLNAGAGNTLRGLAGEAEVIDDLNGFWGQLFSGANAAYPSPTNLPGVNPDIAVSLQNSMLFLTSSVTLNNVATSSGGLTNVTFGSNITQNYVEVKSGIEPSGIAKGVDQAVRTAGAIKAAGLGAISTLVVDADAWNKLSPQDRSAYVLKASAAGAYIQVQPGLAEAARKRAQRLIDKARKKAHRKRGLLW